MWSVREEGPVKGGRRFTVRDDGEVASFERVVASWSVDPGFRATFSDALACCPYRAFRWETPGVTSELGAEPFEFVLIDSPSLDRPADASAFAAHLGGEPPVVAFENLGRDATLVVPQPGSVSSSYAHLASFLRSAPDAHKDALWAAVGRAMAKRIGTRPVWLSTAGAGAPWLHVRLDDRPKYYAHRPYARRP